MMRCTKCEHSTHATLCPCHGCFIAAEERYERTRELLDSTLAQLHATQEARDHAKEKCKALTEKVLESWQAVKASSPEDSRRDICIHQQGYESGFQAGHIEGRYGQTIALTEAQEEAYAKGLGPRAELDRYKQITLALIERLGDKKLRDLRGLDELEAALGIKEKR